MTAYTREEIAQMDDSALVAAWAITTKGRQYDGVEDDRRMIGSEMAERLTDD